jgi:NitT/TauT family transport system substrate-binding protein
MRAKKRPESATVLPHWLVMATAALLLGGAAAHAAPLKLRIAWTSVPAQLTPVLLQRSDLLDHEGKSYTVEHVHFSEAAPVERWLAAGEIDIAALSPATLGVAIENAGLEDLRIVADGYQDGVGGSYSSEFMVRSDSPIWAIDDLQGKVAAIHAPGLASTALHVLLSRRGLEDPRDYKTVVAPVPSMGAMLEDGRIDLAALVAPFAQRLAERGTGRRLFDLRAAIGPSQGLVYVARAAFLDRNRAALEDFLEDYLRALRWFLDPAHRDEAVAAVARFNHDAVGLYAGYLFSDGDYYRDRDARPNLAALQANLRLLRDEGLLATDIDLRRYTDLSFVDGAVARLK